MLNSQNLGKRSKDGKYQFLSIENLKLTLSVNWKVEFAANGRGITQLLMYWAHGLGFTWLRLCCMQGIPRFSGILSWKGITKNCCQKWTRNGDKFMPGGRVGKRSVSVAERSSRDQDEFLPRDPTVFGERGDTVKWGLPRREATRKGHTNKKSLAVEEGGGAFNLRMRDFEAEGHPSIRKPRN